MRVGRRIGRGRDVHARDQRGQGGVVDPTGQRDRAAQPRAGDEALDPATLRPVAADQQMRVGPLRMEAAKRLQEAIDAVPHLERAGEADDECMVRDARQSGGRNARMETLGRDCVADDVNS